MNDKALLIIDMQNDFVLEGAVFRVKGALDVVDNIKKVLEEFRANKLPIFHVVRVHKEDGSDVEITRKEVFSKTPFGVEGAKGAEIIDELKPNEGEVVVKKTRMSAFFNTDLETKLKSMNVNEVFVVGIQTPNCIRATAFDSVAYDYETYLVDDAVAAQNEEIHNVNVMDMKNIGIKMVKTEEVGSVIR
ncbi:MAG: isochorismatase family cysteine hydrolase [Nanoarchaeota archaeon]|nr:isochorismatase family cysteine hydrolase [Nanoarchaeota archaeon]